MKLGVLSKVFSRPTVEAVFDAIAAVGLECIQFNMESAGLVPMPDEIPADLPQRVRRAAAASGLQIVSVQGTFNMSHPDAEFRCQGLRRLEKIAAVGQQVGAPFIAICLGTRDREDMWRYHPENGSPEAWRDMVSCVREALEIAERAGVTLAFEPEVTNVVDSAQQARRLLDEIHSPRLKVTMDGANLFHVGDVSRMSEVLDNAFALVGRDMVIAHAKDFDQEGDMGRVAAGHGLLDYDHYIRLLYTYQFDGPLLLHGLPESMVPGCIAFLREKLAHAKPDR